jgi:class 3 adenylate cyclase/tetratricopeptide (TPR) repeat protein
MPALSRKTVTVLFSDVVDWTPLGESLDAEQVRALMSRYFAEMRTVIERHGGSVEKYIGDEIMAVFGIPNVHEDDALRAVRAAHEMREALAALNRELPDQLSIRTGLATGEVVTGGGDTLVTGDTVNVASRLEQAAGTGEIQIAESTRQLVRDAIVAEPAGELALRGKSQPVEAWRLVDVLPDTLGRARRFDAELVGRDDDLALLRRAYARAVTQRSCHLFTVLGAAGVGKSRLVNELLDELRESAHTLVGRCLPYGEGITFWPLRDMLSAVPNLRAHVADAEAAAIEAAIGEPNAPSSREETFRAVRLLVEALARNRPVVLAIDDLHWAEPTFLDLVEHLVDSVVDAPVLLLALGRPELLEDRPHWGGGKINATTILVEPLDAEESERLVENLAAETLDADVRRTITLVAEGNPLFLEELVAAAEEEPGSVGVPGSIQALLAARLERLPADERDVAATAAVVGRFFTGALVSMLAGGPVEDELAALERKHLIRSQRVPFGDGSGFRFRHVLIRDAAYESLSKSRRRELHSLCADALASTGEDTVELIGLHLEHAARYARDLGAPDTALDRRAADALGVAALRAFDRSDMPATRSLAERTLALDGSDRFDVRRALGVARWNLGDPAGAIAVLRELEGDAEGAADLRALWQARLDRLAFEVITGDTERTELVNASHEAIAVFEKLDDAGGLARAWRGLAVVELQRLRYANAALLAELARTFATEVGATHELMRLADFLGTSLVQGPVPIADAFARCVQLAEEETSLVGRANVLCSLALLHALGGRIADARSAVEDAGAIFAELGLPLLASGATEVHGEVELTAGVPERAEELFRQALAARGGFGREQALVARLAAALLAQGKVEEARQTLSLVDVAEPDPRFLLVSAAVALAGGDPQAAVEQSVRAETAFEDTEAVLFQAEAAAVAALAHEAAGNSDEAAAARERAAVIAAAKGTTAMPPWVASLPSVHMPG